MKNLKKLSVVLFATLLSFNFTSCIDDGVSDAVDQVYLAQAEFLKAQAALQEAMAQAELAEATRLEAVAAWQLAMAEVQLAYARETDANTAQIEANTANIIAAAQYTAAVNAMALVKMQAELDVYLVELQEELAEAQSSLAVRMLELSEAIAATKNDMIRGLYGIYSQKMSAANSLYDQRVTKLNQIAKQNLYLVSGDDVSMAFAQQQLVDALAMLNADLATANAEITRLEGLSPSQAQMDVTALEAEKAMKDAKRDSLGVVLAARENDVTEARNAWEGATSDLTVINNKRAEIKTVSDAIKAHKDDMAQDSADIIEYQHTIDVKIPAADAAILTAEADAEALVVAAEAAVTAAEAAIVTAEALVTTTTADEAAKLAIHNGIAADLGTETLPAPTAASPKLGGTTKYDILYDAQVDLAIIQADIAALYATYQAAVTALAAHEATEAGLITTQANAVTVQGAAQADYDAAVIEYDSNRTGSTVTNPGADGIAGDPNDGLTTYVYVTTAAAPSAAPGTANITAVGALDPADSGVAAPIAGALKVSLADVEFHITGEIPADAVGDHYDAEADDTTDTNVNILNAATAALDAANIALAAANANVDTYNTTLATLEADYLYKQGLFDDAAAEEALVQATVDTAQGDVNTVTAALAVALADYNAATTAKNNAIAALGVDIADPTSHTQTPWAVEDTAFKVLWNRQWDVLVAENNKVNAVAIATGARTALGTVASLEALIAAEWAEIAEINDFLPSHEAALAHLEAELLELMGSFNLDELLFDPYPTDNHGLWYVIDNTGTNDLGYIPLLADYLNAITARNAVSTLMAACVTEMNMIKNTIDHIQLYLLGDGVTPSVENVESFEDWVADAIAEQKHLIDGMAYTDSANVTHAAIDGLIKDIEQAETDINIGEYDQEVAERNLAEYERELVVIEAKLHILETSAATILARIEALMN